MPPKKVFLGVYGPTISKPKVFGSLGLNIDLFAKGKDGLFHPPAFLGIWSY